MKIFKVSIISLLLGIITFTAAQPTMDQKIAAIINATPQERVERMNKFKRSLAMMNSAERNAAIAQMRSSMNQNIVQVNDQTSVQKYVNQATQSKEMQTIQQMSQKQTATQAMQQGFINNTHTGGTGGIKNNPTHFNEIKIPNKFLKN